MRFSGLLVITITGPQTENLTVTGERWGICQLDNLESLAYYVLHASFRFKDGRGTNMVCKFKFVINVQGLFRQDVANNFENTASSFQAESRQNEPRII